MLPMDDRLASHLSEDGLQSLRELAERWAKLDQRVCTEAPYSEFQSAVLRLPEAVSGARNVKTSMHENCRISFRTRLARKEMQNEKLLLLGSENPGPQSDAAVDVTQPYRIRRGSLQKKRVCFVCNEETANDSKPFNSGGLGRCSEKNAVSKIEHARDMKVKDDTDKFHEAAKRLDVILSGASYDVFAVDVYYHKTCYDNFTYTYERKLLPEDDDTSASDVMENFFKLFDRMVIKDHNAYFLLELLADIKDISDEHGLEEPPIDPKRTH